MTRGTALLLREWRALSVRFPSSLKFYGKCYPTSNRSTALRRPLREAFTGAVDHAHVERGADTMPDVKEAVIAVQAVALLLFISHAFPSPDEGYGRWIGPSFWLSGEPIPEARFLAIDSMAGGASRPVEREPARNLTPQARIRDVFAQFVPVDRHRAI